MDISELLLDFRITSKCNLACDLCFRNPGIDDQPFNAIQVVIEKMYQIGFRRIGFTGGEPTLRSDYLDMIRYAKGLGFLTYLSTVGHDFISHLDQLNNVLDWVGLPIDGIDTETNTDIRSSRMAHQHEAIRDIFNSLSLKSSPIKIKLTTVVSKSNLQKLNSIVSFVDKLPYDYQAWRFYQFCPLGLGKEKQEKLEIPTEEFVQQMQLLKSRYPQKSISGATFAERDKANVVMEPNFDVIIPDGEGYSYLCNMQNDTPEFIVASIIGRLDILEKCAANRFWVY